MKTFPIIRIYNIEWDEPVYWCGKLVTEETYDFNELGDEDYELLQEEGIEEYFTTLFVETFGVGVKSFQYEFVD